MTPIEFRDEEGMRWTVEHRATPRDTAPRHAVLDLMCETGEYRVAEVLPLENGEWDTINEQAWRTVLRRARVVRGRPKADDE